MPLPPRRRRFRPEAPAPLLAASPDGTTWLRPFVAPRPTPLPWAFGRPLLWPLALEAGGRDVARLELGDLRELLGLLDDAASR